MNKREPLMTEAYFAKRLEVIDQELTYYKELIETPSPGTKLNLANFNWYNQLFARIEAAYSQGSAIDSLRPFFLDIVQALSNYRDTAPQKEKLFLVGEVDEYMNALALLCWGLTLNVPPATFDQLVAIIDSDGKRDALLDVLIRSRKPQRVQSETLIFPELYQPLYDTITRQPIAEAGIVAFLQRWYKTCLKRTSLYNLHLKHGGDDSGFTGYWAWEVAGLTHAFGIDDSTYRTMPYYPADLVAYAHQ